MSRRWPALLAGIALVMLGNEYAALGQEHDDLRPAMHRLSDQSGYALLHPWSWGTAGCWPWRHWWSMQLLPMAGGRIFSGVMSSAVDLSGSVVLVPAGLPSWGGRGVPAYPVVSSVSSVSSFWSNGAVGGWDTRMLNSMRLLGPRRAIGWRWAEMAANLQLPRPLLTRPRRPSIFDHLDTRTYLTRNVFRSSPRPFARAWGH